MFFNTLKRIFLFIRIISVCLLVACQSPASQVQTSQAQSPETTLKQPETPQASALTLTPPAETATCINVSQTAQTCILPQILDQLAEPVKVLLRAGHDALLQDCQHAKQLYTQALAMIPASQPLAQAEVNRYLVFAQQACASTQKPTSGLSVSASPSNSPSTAEPLNSPTPPPSASSSTETASGAAGGSQTGSASPTPTVQASQSPSTQPTATPTTVSSTEPTTQPSTQPTSEPTPVQPSPQSTPYQPSSLPVWQRSQLMAGPVISLATDGAQTLLAATADARIWRSTDLGNSWSSPSIPDIVLPTEGALNVGFGFTHLAFDPQNPQHVWAGRCSGPGGGYSGGGLWHSQNAGASWQRVSNTIFKTNTFVCGISFASGSLFIHANNGSGSAEGKLYQSTDQGANWTSVSGLAGVTVSSVLADQEGALYAATLTALRKSSDGGANWAVTPLTNEKVRDLVLTPSGNLLALAGSGRVPYRSTNQGASWSLTSGAQGVALAANDTYVLLADTDGKIWRSSDNGLNWQAATAPCGGEVSSLRSHQPESSRFYLATHQGICVSENQGASWQRAEGTGMSMGYVGKLAITAADSQKVFALSRTPRSFHRSHNRGQSWDLLSVPEFPWSSSQTFDIGALAADPQNPDILYAGFKPGGLWKSSNMGQSWQELTQGIPNLAAKNVLAIAINPQNPQQVYASFSGNGMGLFRSSDRGASWSLTSLPSTSVRDIRIHPATGTIFTATGAGIYKSTDQGDNWVACNTGLNSSQLANTNHVALSASEPNILYAILALNGIYKSVNGGESWTPVNTGLTGIESAFGRALEVDPTNPDIVYAGWHHLVYYQPGPGLFITQNGGQSWQRVTTSLPTLNPNILAILIDPRQSQRVYIGSGGEGVLYSN